MRDNPLREAKRLRAIRAYQTYLQAVKLSHDASFLQDDIGPGCSILDNQLSLYSEIEIVEDILMNLQNKGRFR
jgi:hypothetical protein